MTDRMVAVPAPVEVAGKRFSLSLKHWETDFFGRTFGSLTWETTARGAFSIGPAAEALGNLCRRADAAGLALVECHVDGRDFNVAAALERVGFRLVDSRIRFLTKMTVADIPDEAPSWGRIAQATRAHHERIIELTHTGLTHNDTFVSRFKNPEYFSADESRRYFEAWIENTAFEDDSASAVFEVDDEVVGYYIYQARGTYEGLPVVKGILTVVQPEHRGANAQLAMQAFLHRRIGFQEWYLDNTTQLTNLTVIRNHMRSGKRLEEIVLTFYRTSGGGES